MNGYSLLKNSLLYRERQAERAEIERHKWYESERAGYDIGIEHAVVDWMIKHRSGWIRDYRKKHPIVPVHVGNSSSTLSSFCS